MASFNAMKQIGNKNVGFKVEIVQWSNKMDLLAISNEKGEVMIHRLKWKKLWVLSPPDEEIKVRGIAWRPDEKLIACAYSNGKVIILDIENKEEIYSTNHMSDITCLSWTQNTKDLLLDDENQLIDSHKTYLPPMPNLNSLSSTAKKQDFNILKFYSKKSINFLVVGLANGIVDISVFGTLPCGKINVLHHLKNESEEITIKDAKMSADFKQLFVLVTTEDSLLQMLMFENGVLAKFSVPLLNLAIKHGQILNTMSYINDTIQSITEAWEAVLLEMDNKLNKYANTQPEGSLSADFLELLMFGHPSDALDQFLTRDLTEKGIKKLGNSIELSYSTIQKLVVKPLHISIINVFYHLSSLEGMIRNGYYYKPLMGNAKNKALSVAGSFLIKAYELQQTIDTSTRDFKIFFRWLHVAIIRLMDESVPEDISNVTQQDINYLADFLANFDRDPTDEASSSNTTGATANRKFNLERVGQYLQDKNLTDPPKTDTNLWDDLLDNNECLKNCDLVYPHNKGLSLVQEHNRLTQEIDSLFKIPETVIAEDFRLGKVLRNMDFGGCSTHIYDESEMLDFIVVLESDTSFLFIEIDRHANVRLLTVTVEESAYFTQPKWPQLGRLSFKNIQFYNNNTISILMRGSLNERKSVTCFMQQSVTALRKLAVDVGKIVGKAIVSVSAKTRTVNAYDVIEESTVKVIENMDSSLMAVSGSRKVAAFVSDSLKGIRLYEMEVEVEEDDEQIDDVSQNTSLDNSKESNKE